MANNKKTNSKIREEAFILIFETLFNDITIADELENSLEIDDREYSSEAIDKAYAIEEHKDELDEIISKYLKTSWKLSRISKTSHAILLVAIYEIKYDDDIPTSVAINEAVELAKKFTVPDDSSFINGILGSYVRDNNG